MLARNLSRHIGILATQGRTLVALSVEERRRAILKASDGRNFIRIGFPRSDIRNTNSTRAFSSDSVRCCWL